MTIASCFEALERQYANQLPFVVYSRPINALIKCWLQEDDTLYTTDTFSESGFVFAPFDIKNQSILLPEAHSKHITLEIESEFQLETNKAQNFLSADENDKNDHIDDPHDECIDEYGAETNPESCVIHDPGDGHPFFYFLDKHGLAAGTHP